MEMSVGGDEVGKKEKDSAKRTVDRSLGRNCGGMYLWHNCNEYIYAERKSMGCVFERQKR